jgi:hypothetical protein
LYKLSNLYLSPSFGSLTLVLNRDEWCASQPGSFTLQGKDPDTLWMEGQVGLRADLDAVKKRKVTASARIRTLILSSCP